MGAQSEIATMNFVSMRADIKRWGWMRSLCGRVMRRLSVNLGIHIYMVRTCRLNKKPEYPATLTNISLRMLQSQELFDATEDPNLKLSRNFVTTALERGDFAFGAFDNSKLVALVWRAISTAPHSDGMWVGVRRPYSYVYKSFTRPSHRGRHLSPSLILCSDIECLNRGYTHRAGFISPYNFASRASGKYMGSKIAGYAGYVKWSAFCFTFRTSAVKKIGFEFSRESDLTKLLESHVVN